MKGQSMKIIVDQDKCVASGQCVTAAADVHQAAAVCPALAIVVED